MQFILGLKKRHRNLRNVNNEITNNTLISAAPSYAVFSYNEGSKTNE